METKIRQTADYLQSVQTSKPKMIGHLAIIAASFLSLSRGFREYDESKVVVSVTVMSLVFQSIGFENLMWFLLMFGTTNLFIFLIDLMAKIIWEKVNKRISGMISSQLTPKTSQTDQTKSFNRI